METQMRALDGALFLDGARPGWAGDIDLDILDIGDANRCVLGQLFGDCANGRYVLDLEPPQARELGFVCGCGTTSTVACTCKELTEAWRGEIAARL